MLSRTTRRLRDRTVVTAAILSLMGHDVYAMDHALGGSNKNGDRTENDETRCGAHVGLLSNGSELDG